MTFVVNGITISYNKVVYSVSFIAYNMNSLKVN